MTPSSQQESYWLSSPLVASGTVKSGCPGCFRAADVTEVVLDQHSELQLLSINTAGKLEPVFKQPLFCRIRQMCVLRFSLAQPDNTQLQVLDALLLLLESGSLMVLKYSQLVQRFYVAAELQLSPEERPSPDMLGARVAVSPQPTPAGISIAVVASRGRVACLTASLSLGGGVQLSSPVLYAVPYAGPLQPTLGKSYCLRKRPTMELGDIIDLVLLPAAGAGTGPQQQQPPQQQQQQSEHLAVMHHRPGDSASKLVMFEWSSRQQQLRRLGHVSIENHLTMGNCGMPVSIGLVPRCPTAVLIVRTGGLVLVECSALLQQQHKQGRKGGLCTYDIKQRVLYALEDQQMHHQATHLKDFHCTLFKCVPPSKQTGPHTQQQQCRRQRREQQHQAAHPSAAAAPTPSPTPAAAAAEEGRGAAPNATHAGAIAAQAAAAVAAAGGEALVLDAGDDDVRLFNGLEEMWAAEGDALDYFEAEEEAAAAVAATAAASAAAAAAAESGPDTSSSADGSSGEGDDAAAADETYDDVGGGYNDEGGGHTNDHHGNTNANGNGAFQGHVLFDSSSEGYGDEGDDGDLGPPEGPQLPSITAVAWSGAAAGAACAAHGTAAHVTAGPAAHGPHVGPTSAGLAAGANSSSSGSGNGGCVKRAGAPGVASDELLVLTAGGCLLQLNVSFSSSSRRRSGGVVQPGGGVNPDAGLRSPPNPCMEYDIKVTGYGSAFGDSAVVHITNMLALPQQRLLLIADGESQVLLLQQQQPSAPQAGSAAAEAGTELAAAAAAAAAAEAVGGPGDVMQADNQQAGAAAAAAGQPPHTSDAVAAAAATATAAAADAMDVDAEPHQQGAGAGAGAGRRVSSSSGGKHVDLRQVIAALRSSGRLHDVPYGNSSPVNLPAGSNAGLAAAYAAAAAAAAAARGCDGFMARERAKVLARSAATRLQLYEPDLRQYLVADRLQLLGKVRQVVPLLQYGCTAGVTGSTVPSSGDSTVGGVQRHVPVLAAARGEHQSGIRVLAPSPTAVELLKGPLGMLEGASGIWPISASPDFGGKHVAVVVSFAGGASRALSVGVRIQDVTEVLGLQGCEATLLAACVAEGVAVQVTRAGVRLCCLDAVLEYGSGEGQAGAWRGSPKSSRGTGAWQQQPQQQQQQQQVPAQAAPAAAAAAAGVAGAACRTGAPSRLANGGGSAQAPAQGDPVDGTRPLQAYSPDPAHDGQPGTRPLQGYSPCQAGSSGSGGSPSDPTGGHMAHVGAQHSSAEQWDASGAGGQQQGGGGAGVVVAAAAAGIVVVYTTIGRLVALQVTHHHQQQQQQPRTPTLEPLDLNSDTLAGASGGEGGGSRSAAGGGGSSSSSGCAGSSSSKKRGRGSWGLVDLGAVQLLGQVSCLQVCPASAVLPASPGSSSSSSSSGSTHIVFVGSYDGGLQLFSVAAATGSIRRLASFSQQQLLPLQHLASTLTPAGSSSSGAALASNELHGVNTPIAVPESCTVLLPVQQRSSMVAMADAAGTATGAAADGVACGTDGRSSGRRGRHAAGPTADAVSGCLQFCFSFRTGDVAAYSLDLAAQQQQQQQQQAHGGAADQTLAGPPAAAAASTALRVLSQLRLPHVVQLQLMPQQQQQGCQQLLAVGSQVWMLQLDSVTQQMTSYNVTSEPVLLAAAVSLPQAPVGLTCSSTQPDESAGGAHQQPSDQQQQQQQHLMVVTPAGQLVLLQCCRRVACQPLQTSAWLPGVTVSHLLQHPGSHLLLAACVRQAGAHVTTDPTDGWPGNDTGSCLALLDAGTGDRVASLNWGKHTGHWITCVGFWETPWGSQRGGTGKHSSSRGGSSTAEQQATTQGRRVDGRAGGGGAGLEAAGAVRGGNGGGWTRVGAGRWWQQLRQRQRRQAAAANADADADAAPNQRPEQQQQEQRRLERRRQHRQQGGRSGNGSSRARQRAAGGADGSSSGSEHFFQLESLLRGLESQLPPAAAAAAAAAGGACSSGRSSQGSRVLKQRQGPLIVLGTDAFGDSDGCHGQVLVLQLMHSSKLSSSSSPQQQQQQQPGRSSGAVDPLGSLTAGSSHTAAAAAAGDVTAAGAGTSSCRPASPGAAGGSSNSSSGSGSGSGGSWSLQRVARLRLPDSVSAVAALNSELLLVATVKVLALYQLQEGQLSKAAYCFTREPITSLSTAPAPAAALAAGGGGGGVTPAAAAGSNAGLVFAADALFGVSVFRVNLHAATGQYSLQPVGVHCEVHSVSQVLCLPQDLQPPAPAAALQAAKLAETLAAPLPVVAQQQQSGRSTGGRRRQWLRGDGLAGNADNDMDVDQGDGGASSDTAAAATAAAAASAAQEAESAKQVLFVQQMAEAGLRGLCLDKAGAVVEFGWARQRVVPAKWMRTLACVPLPDKAARRSMSITRGGCGGRWHGAPERWASSQQQQQSLSEALPCQLAEQDGVPSHWLGYPHSNAAASVVVAAASGSVVQLQRLSGPEGELLMTLQQVLLRHPLTSALVLARGQVAGGEQQQGQLQQQQVPQKGWMLPGGSIWGPGGSSVGLGRAPSGAVDGSLLRIFLCLPYQLQLLLLDSVLGQLQEYSRKVRDGEWQMLQDGIRCRLQLVPCPELL